jgi:hypothetical protein
MPKHLSVSEWQGIASAPKTPLDLSETRAFLAWCPDEEAPNGGDCRVVWWEPRTRGGIWYGDRDIEEHPTHWMPLPQPPESSDGE